MISSYPGTYACNVYPMLAHVHMSRGFWQERKKRPLMLLSRPIDCNPIPKEHFGCRVLSKGMHKHIRVHKSWRKYVVLGMLFTALCPTKKRQRGMTSFTIHGSTLDPQNFTHPTPHCCPQKRISISHPCNTCLSAYLYQSVSSTHCAFSF